MEEAGDSKKLEQTSVDHYVQLIIALKVVASITHWVFAVKYLKIVLNVTLILDPHQSQVEQKHKRNRIILWTSNIYFYL